MNSNNIKKHLKSKLTDWILSIDDEEIQDIIREHSIVTGGSIVSLLMGEEPHDYDVYIDNIDDLHKVANYYVEKFIQASVAQKVVDGDGEKSLVEDIQEEDEESIRRKIVIQRCYWNETDNAWTVIHNDKIPKDVEQRLRIFIKSHGAVGENFDMFEDSVSDKHYRDELAKIGERVRTEEKLIKKKDLPKYRPVFLTNNAISLSDKIQIVLRFYGSPEEIHKNYDFVHCSSYYTMHNDTLVLPSKALEAIINKELIYTGSKYPLCSLVRARKFMNRGWYINAGQFVKMALQISDLNLHNLHVFEEQLVGVDSAYFTDMIRKIEKMKENSPDFTPDTAYLIKLINEIFDGEQSDANGSFEEVEAED